MPLADLGLIIIDECHRSLAPSYTKLFALYPFAVVVGLTAMAICQGLVVLVSARMRSATADSDSSTEAHP